MRARGKGEKSALPALAGQVGITVAVHGDGVQRQKNSFGLWLEGGSAAPGGYGP